MTNKRILQELLDITARDMTLATKGCVNFLDKAVQEKVMNTVKEQFLIHPQAKGEEKELLEEFKNFKVRFTV